MTIFIVKSVNFIKDSFLNIQYMKEIELDMLKKLEEGRKRISDISSEMGISRSYASRVAESLERKNLLKKSRHGSGVFIEIPANPKAIMLEKILKAYNARRIFRGKREIYMIEFLEPLGMHEIVKRTGMSTKSAYSFLGEMTSLGVILEKNGKYSLNPEKTELIDYIKMVREEVVHGGAEQAAEVVWRKGAESLKKLPLGSRASGVRTAFSVFPENGIQVFPREEYYYHPAKNISLEEIFVHSLVFSRTKQDMALSMLLYLKHKGRMETERIKEVSRHFGVSGIFLDVLAYIGKNPVKNSSLFLPWNEFMKKAELYGIKIREDFGENYIKGILSEIGGNLSPKIGVYLIGGGNMMLRGLKTATKDLDFVLESAENFRILENALRRMGFERKKIMEKAYEDMKPSAIMDRKNFRVDIFTKTVCNALILSKEMRKESESLPVGRLELKLPALEDVFLFKSITDREGDLEDCRIISERGLAWERMLSEVLRQEELTGRYFSFSVLDTLHALQERYGIKAPITKKLDSHCLEIALLLLLRKPRTIRELRKEIDFPEYQILNKVRKLEKEKKISVSRKGKLNKYMAIARLNGVIVR